MQTGFQLPRRHPSGGGQLSLAALACVTYSLTVLLGTPHASPGAAINFKFQSQDFFNFRMDKLA
jgi:hypothetical protein